MKSLMLLSILAISSASALENNAYISFERHDNRMQMCIIMNDHYYISDMPRHFEDCPCESMSTQY